MRFFSLRHGSVRRLMGELVNGRWYNVVAWATAAVVTALAAVYVGVTVPQAFGVNVG